MNEQRVTLRVEEINVIDYDQIILLRTYYSKIQEIKSKWYKKNFKRNRNKCDRFWLNNIIENVLFKNIWY